MYTWRPWFIGLGVFAAVALLSGGVNAEDKKDDKKPAEPAKKDPPAPPAGDKKPAGDAKKDEKHGAPDAAMAAMMELGKPGPEHKILESMVGNWEHTGRWRMAPADPWQEFKGTTMREVLFGGRYIRQESKGPGTMPGDPPFEGRGITGFDRVRKQYVSIWIDNEGTSAMTAYGTADASGKVITYSSDDPDMKNLGKLKKVKSVYRFKDEKTHAFEMYDTGPDGKEYVMMELTYTKK